MLRLTECSFVPSLELDSLWVRLDEEVCHQHVFCHWSSWKGEKNTRITTQSSWCTSKFDDHYHSTLATKVLPRHIILCTFSHFPSLSDLILWYLNCYSIASWNGRTVANNKWTWVKTAYKTDGLFSWELWPIPVGHLCFDCGLWLRFLYM